MDAGSYSSLFHVRRLAAWVLGTLSVAVLVSGCALESVPPKRQASAVNPITVPVLRGLTVEEAVDSLEELGLVPVVDPAGPDADHSACTGAYWGDPVHATDPSAGLAVDTGQEIRIITEAVEPRDRWLESTHILAIKVDNPAWCFDCHKPAECAECHEREVREREAGE